MESASVLTYVQPDYSTKLNVKCAKKFLSRQQATQSQISPSSSPNELTAVTFGAEPAGVTRCPGWLQCCCVVDVNSFTILSTTKPNQ